jgi:hypothetical protein
MMRVAAGVAVVFVITVAGGFGAAITSADPGSSRSPSGHSRDGGHSRRDGDGPQGRRDSRDGDRRGDHRPGNDRRGDNDGGNRTPAGNDRQPTRDTAGRDTSSVDVPESTTASRGVVVQPAAPTVIAEVPTAPSPVSGVGAGGGGSASGESAPPIVTPRVIVGDGRRPGVLPQRPAEVSSMPEVAPPLSVVPVPPLPVLAPSVPLPLTAESSPWPLSGTPVASLWVDVQPGWPMGALVGVAGLLLAPIGGIWMGHRQARAAKAASQLVSHSGRTPSQAGA